MANIDVSELMNDPDFVNSFCIKRRPYSVNAYGKTVVTETCLDAIGSIQGADKDTLKRNPDCVDVSRLRTIYTKTKLLVEAKGRYCDLIIWEDDVYQVLKCTPWSNFGAGWYMADCEMQDTSSEVDSE